MWTSFFLYARAYITGTQPRRGHMPHCNIDFPHFFSDDVLFT